ncbi:MAG: bifunctional folylpolyglutamate synthase/dihydrofolate synthase [Candidatus Aminicenantia bacterium]
MNYQEALLYLQSIEKYGIKFGLDNVETILSEFDNPHTKFPSILVGGTNGKGSVCAMLAEVLKRHNYKVGLYTSPHLIEVRERIKINNTSIPPYQLARFLILIKKKIAQLLAEEKIDAHLTYFEVLTVCAFLYFFQKKVDIAVLEVGMGGRLDATNVVHPIVSIITNISKDHQDFLGNSLGKIAFEKAGIIKKNVPIVCGCKKGIAYQIIKERAKEINAPFYDLKNKKKYKIKKINHRYLVESCINNHYYQFRPGLLGQHQVENAIIAISALELISQKWKKLDESKIIKGIEEVNWPGRLEIISAKPKILLDGAHNLEGIKAIKKFIKDFIPGPITLVFAIMKDKEIEKITQSIFPIAKNVILTKFPYYRAADPKKFKRLASQFEDKIIIEYTPLKALEKAKQLSSPDETILVTGSLYLVGEIKKYLTQDLF